MSTGKDPFIRLTPILSLCPMAGSVAIPEICAGSVPITPLKWPCISFHITIIPLY